MFPLTSATQVTLSGDCANFGSRSSGVRQAGENARVVGAAGELAIRRKPGVGFGGLIQVRVGASASALPDGRGVKSAVRASSSRPLSELREGIFMAHHQGRSA